MYISVDIGKIRSHTSVLQEEQREARRLLEALNLWSKQAAATGVPDVEWLQTHICIADNQLQNIQRRITLLESMASKFADARDKAESILSEDTQWNEQFAK